MKQHSLYLLIMLNLFGFTPMPSALAAVPDNIHFTYNKDSDAITTKSLKTDILSEENPWNLTLYQTYIDQSGKSLAETTAVAKYRLAVNDRDNITLWLGAANNNITSFYSYAAMYDGPHTDRGHFWLSHGREALGTITAYEQDIHSNTTSFSYLYNFSPTVSGSIVTAYTSYNDGNSKNKTSVEFTKQLNYAVKITAGYLIDSAKRKATGLYYVPVNEKSAFIGTEITLPAGEGNFVFTGDKALFAKNSDGTIGSHHIGLEYKLKNLSTGLHYHRSGDYWSRAFNLSWQRFW